MRILNVKQARWVDELAVQQFHFHSLQLMENAGRGAVDYLCECGVAGPVVIACGKGNNAGDGYVMARHLMIRGHECRILQCCDEGELRGDAAKNLAIARAVGVSIAPLELARVAGQTAEMLKDADWAVDALLGTGAQGSPRAPFDQVIETLNDAKVNRLAVDVPSGLNAETGEAGANCFRADHTVTFVAAKKGLVADTARPFVGKMHVTDIGLPLAAIEEQLNDESE